jgi:puromycin-sensitive aminopeptidase
MTTSLTSRYFRLSAMVRPRRYTLALDVRMRSWTFTAEESVAFTQERARRSVVLHGVRLRVEHVTLDGQPARHRAYAASGTVEFTPRSGRLSAGEHVLAVRYRGKITDTMRGFYRSTQSGARYAATQFESCEARRALFCFDEPSFRAPLRLSISVAQGAGTALSNAPREKRRVIRGRVNTTFAPTPPLPTYLYAWVIGPLKPTRTKRTAGGTPVTVWLPRDTKAAQGTYALEAHVRAVEWMERYTGIPYPFAKLDGIGLPDFEAAAMENAGCITYRMTDLACDPTHASSDRRHEIFDSVAHEVAHQWFGNLVTMTWWNDAWLKESFATYVAVKIVDELNPAWGVWRRHVLDTEDAFRLDALRTAHPVVMRVRTPEEADERFDDITYDKSAAILRMSEHLLGSKRFRAGVRAYLRAHLWCHAGAGDFWSALEGTSTPGFTALVDTWLRRPGHPLVAIATRPARGGLELRVRQDRYQPLGRIQTDPWPIPLGLASVRASGAREDIRVRMSARRASLRIQGALLFANSDAAGFYRVVLSDDGFEDLVTQHYRRLNPCERVFLLTNTIATVRSGDAPPQQLLTLLGRVGRADDVESDPVVAELVLDALRWLDDAIVDDATRCHLRQLIRATFAQHLARLGWDRAAGEPIDDARMRGLAVNALGVLGADELVRAIARGRINAYLDGTDHIDGDLLPELVHAAAAGGDDRLYARYVRHMRASANDPQEKDMFQVALTSFEAPALVARTLELVERDLRVQDQSDVLAELLRGRASRTAAFAHVARGWRRIAKRVGTVGQQKLIETLGGLGATEVAPAAAAVLRAHRQRATAETTASALENLNTLRAQARRLRPQLGPALRALISG